MVLALCGLAGCGAPLRSTMDYRGLRTTWQAAFFVNGHDVAVRATNPSGAALVVWPPRIEGGDVVFNAGVASAGGGGDVRYCFRLAPARLTDDWRTRLFWREPDGTRAPITEFEQGTAARSEIARCATIEPSR